LAWLLYLRSPQLLERIVPTMRAVGLYGLSAGKFFFDAAYEMLIVWPLEAIARACAWVDREGVDGLVNAVGSLPGQIGSSIRWLQAGLVPFYALVMLLGMLLMMGALLM
jgi:hypothetical protein